MFLDQIIKTHGWEKVQTNFSRFQLFLKSYCKKLFVQLLVLHTILGRMNTFDQIERKVDGEVD